MSKEPTTRRAQKVSTSPGRRGDRASLRALAWIERHIEARGIKAGDSLPGEEEIARSAGVGRGSVREALTAMKALGLIRSRPRQGIRLLRNPVLLELRHYFGSRLAGAERFADVMEFRAVLEWGLGTLMLAHADKATCLKLRRIIQQVADGGGDQDIALAEERFHTALAESAGNRLGTLLAQMYGPMFRRDVADSPFEATDEAIGKWVDQHAALVDSLEARDEAAFLTALQRHTHQYMRHECGQRRSGRRK